MGEEIATQKLIAFLSLHKANLTTDEHGFAKLKHAKT
jgi:hypothetical protein